MEAVELDITDPTSIDQAAAKIDRRASRPQRLPISNPAAMTPSPLRR
jgi:hypothetical protein